MCVMEKLCEVYVVVDYVIGFFDVVFKKVVINVNFNIVLLLFVIFKFVINYSVQILLLDNFLYMIVLEIFFNEKFFIEGCMFMMFLEIINGVVFDFLSGSIGSVNVFVGVNFLFYIDFGLVVDFIFSVSGGLDVGGSGGVEQLDVMDLDFMQGYDEFDWNVVVGMDFDVDQWLQFLLEGVNGGEEGLNVVVVGVMRRDQDVVMVMGQSVGWDGNIMVERRDVVVIV